MEIMKSIQNRIYELRGERVMLDFDLAALYQVETKVLNQAVKRHIKRFPDDFMFRLTNNEWQGIRVHSVTALETNTSMRSQFVTGYLPLMRSQFATGYLRHLRSQIVTSSL